MRINFFSSLLIIFFAVFGCKSQTDTGSINSIGKMSESRAYHTATLLRNGKVLIAGGFSNGERRLASTEIFDSANKTFSAGETMSVSRAGHSATLLPDGNVLIAGGFNGEYLDSAEIYDVKTNKFIPAGKMTMPRSEHIAVLLKNGKVLLAGGVGTGWTFLAEAEIFDPATNTFSKIGKMTAARTSHTATLLADGTILITGGHQGRRSALTVYQSAEIFNPQKNTFTPAANLTVKRHKHDALSLNDGRVLIIGGSDERDSQGAYTNVEIYNPKTKEFSKIGDMRLSRYKLQGTSVLLKNGKVLIAGGTKQAEIFNPVTNSFEIAAGNFETELLFSTATLLPDGQVLVVGGYNVRIQVSSSAWMYKT